jgi:UDP-galactopyranose mutase
VIKTNDKQPIIIVGAGLSGATIARKYAEDGEQVIVVDKRDHIGGNTYDFINEHGVLMAKYGAHIYHDSDDETWEFVSRFTEWIPYEHRVKSYVEGKLVPVPTNMDTYNEVLGKNFTDGEELKEWVESQHPEITDPKNSEESALKRIGSDVIYEKMFKNYTKKQWDKYPTELDASVMERIPVRYDHNDRYFGDKYEGIPKHGYTVMARNMLDHENIKVILGRDYHDMSLPEPKLLFYTGKIDTYFGEKFGKLEYRSIEFEHETRKTQSYQDHAVVNYPGEEFPYTRIIEHKKFFGEEYQNLPITTITREYSIAGGEPYYPVPNQENRDLYEKYQKEAEKLEEQGIYFIGRLASYKYFNMNQAIRAALDLYERLNKA